MFELSAEAMGDKVSSYLKERVILKYIRDNTEDEETYLEYIGSIISVRARYTDEVYSRLMSNGKISLSKLLAPLRSSKK